jgi:L-gulonate 5-dehydrogenase
VLGFHPEPAKIPEVIVVKKELKIVGSRMNCRRFPQVIEWFEKGQVNPEPLISAVYPFEKIDTAFREILEDPEKYLKVLITY